MDPDFAAQVSAHLDGHLAPLLEATDAPTAEEGALRAELSRFCAVLAAENQNLNLTGIKDPEGMALRHVLDSLVALPALGTGLLVDLGSGCGVPGIPLALARPDLSVVLVESRQRKAAALGRLVEAMGLGDRVTAAHARGEAWLQDHRVDTVVTRAVGSVDAQLKLLGKAREAFSRLVMLKGPAVEQELADAEPRRTREDWPQPSVLSATLPGDAGQRAVVLFEFEGSGS